MNFLFLLILFLTWINQFTAEITNDALIIGDLCRDNIGYWIFGFIRKIGWDIIFKVEVYVIFNVLQVV